MCQNFYQTTLQRELFYDTNKRLLDLKQHTSWSQTQICTVSFLWSFQNHSPTETPQEKTGYWKTSCLCMAHALYSTAIKFQMFDIIQAKNSKMALLITSSWFSKTFSILSMPSFGWDKLPQATAIKKKRKILKIYTRGWIKWPSLHENVTGLIKIPRA